MFVVGLTGGVGSGKTAASDRFASLGIDIVDADVVSRQLVLPGSPALQEITDHFGPDVLQASGELDRALLRERVFSQPEEKRWLEALLHPLMGVEILTQLNAAQSPYVLLVSPLLIETGQTQLCQRVLVVDAPEALQITRTCQRDDNTEEQVKSIVAAQTSRERRREAATDLIDNSSSLTSLWEQVDNCHQHFLSLARAATE